MTPRLYVVGTDTGVGKTALVCALLRHARAHGLLVLPFKPVVSGPDGPDADPERLLRAAALDPSERDAVSPIRYPAPLAPGLAHDPAPFRDPAPRPPDPEPLARATATLAALERRFDPDLVILEGAGGLLVPMPGGTWQPAWVTALASAVVVVGRAGLGTINHTLLTTQRLRSLPVPVRGFALSHTTKDPDPSRADNPHVIAAATALPYLGSLPHLPDPDDPPDHAWLRPDVWDLLLARP